MFETLGPRLRLTEGDYGTPVSVSLAPHCIGCGADLLGEDVIRITVEQAGVELIRRDVTWLELQTVHNGEYPFAILKDEAPLLQVGLYTWRARLLRHGHLRATLITATLEVVP